MEDATGRPVTIAQVAHDAGVSIPTVSRVLNGSAPVADDTRQRVVASIERLGYHPNPMARGLSRGHSEVVLVVVPHITEPSVTLRLSGLISVLRSTPYELHLVDVERPESERERSLADLVASYHPAGTVVISLPPTEEDTARFEASASPVVLVDVSSESLPADAIDDVSGGMIATRHLLSLGHRRIAFVGDQEDTAIGIPASADRRHGYERALRDVGIDVNADYIRTVPHGIETAHAAALELLDRPDAPTAVFAASDVQAFGVLEAARELGRKVPSGLSVVGFDDIISARLVGLTTVRQPLEVSGVRAGLRLLERLGHPLPLEMPEFSALELIARRTTGPVPGDTHPIRSMVAASHEAATSEKQVSTALDPASRRDERIPRRK